MVIRTPSELAAVIKEQRNRLGWTQEELAHQIGVKRNWVCEMEKGKSTVQLINVLLALNALQITISVEMPHQKDLLNEEEGEIDLNALFD